MTHVRDFIERVEGFRVGSADAGLRKQPAPDMAFVVADEPCTAAGVFTTNQVKAAPVLLDMERLKDHPERIRGVLINAGCANACTGAEGMANAQQTAAWAAAEIGCQPDEVLVMSTGVIGTQLQVEKMRTGIADAVRSAGPEKWEKVYRAEWDHIRALHERLAHDRVASVAWKNAADAIMTTDTKPKLASFQGKYTPPDAEDFLQEIDFTIAGIAKGAGMIAPNMATLLVTIVTDVKISAPVLDAALHHAVERSFNQIVIDGDMSTNDTVLVLASGKGDLKVVDHLIPVFTEALTEVCVNLATKIVRDGEGVTRFITLNVTGARNVAEARQIANTIAISPLVKTAFYGGDANWGRIMMAAGRAGVALDQDKLSLWYDGLQLVANGTPLNYDDAQANALAAQPDVTVRLDLGLGDHEATVWTCDLSHEYVSINGHYRT